MYWAVLEPLEVKNLINVVKIVYLYPPNVDVIHSIKLGKKLR